MTAVAADPAVVEVQRLLGPDDSRYPGDPQDCETARWRNCPTCGAVRYGMPITCATRSCLRTDVADEIDADRRAES